MLMRTMRFFVECCHEGKELISSGKDNLGTMKVVLGIYESARTGKAVDLGNPLRQNRYCNFKRKGYRPSVASSL